MKMYDDEHASLDSFFIESFPINSEKIISKMLISDEEFVMCDEMTLDEHELAITGLIHI